MQSGCRVRRGHPGNVVSLHGFEAFGRRSNAWWCSDGFEFHCYDGAPLRVIFALDCCDREAMSWAVTTGGYTGDMVRDVMLQAVGNRFDGALKPTEIGRAQV